MNNNYVLLGLSVLAVASIYLFWLNYKQTQEIRNLCMRFGNVGGVSPEIQEDLSTKFNKFDGDLDKLKQYVFGELLPRLEKQHHITQQKLQELQYHTGLVDLPTEVDNNPSENVSCAEDESVNQGDDECSVNGSDQCLDDLDLNDLDIDELDGLNMDDLDKTLDYNSEDMDVEDLDDMKSVVFNDTKLDKSSPVADTLVADTLVADTLVADTPVADTLVADTQHVELDSKTLNELKTMARELGIKPKGNKNDLIKTLLGNV